MIGECILRYSHSWRPVSIDIDRCLHRIVLHPFRSLCYISTLRLWAGPDGPLECRQSSLPDQSSGYQKEGDLMAENFAVIRTGGKMYRVAPGQILVVERLEEEGAVIFDQVLMVSEEGVISYATEEKPLSVEVHGRILRQEKDPKIIVFKKKRRKNYRRKKGHRQLVSRVKIESIIKTA